jgi:rhomboid family GlyGly-CTERM serine protease
MFNKLPTAPHQIVVVLAILFISLLAFIFEDNVINALVYERHSIAQYELWRLITGHFFHSNINHLLLNIGGVLLIWSLHGQHYKTLEYAVFFTFSALFTGLCLYFLSPDIKSYVGLSGVLHGIFVWGVIYDIRKKISGAWVLLLGVIGKLLYEQMYGAEEAIKTLIEAPVAIDAHLWGAISGLLFALLLWLYPYLIVNKTVK